jgi:hypothetical protein
MAWLANSASRLAESRVDVTESERMDAVSGGIGEGEVIA